MPSHESGSPLLSHLRSLEGRPLDASVFEGRVVMIVNVASRCGLTPQLAGLERLQQRFEHRGFTILAVPCNQFAGQEPGTPEQLSSFCSTVYGTTFPIAQKLEVNGRRRHPLYEWLVQMPDDAGVAGDVEWNFEKFLVSPAGIVRARFRPAVDPESDEVTAAIQRLLP